MILPALRILLGCLIALALAAAGCASPGHPAAQVTGGSLRAEAKAVERPGEAGATVEVSLVAECRWGGM